ncbi:hypothetical protein [Comamonas humi]
MQTAMRRDRLAEQLQIHKRKLAQLYRGEVEDIRLKYHVMELLGEEVRATVDFIAEYEDDFHYRSSFDQLDAELTRLDEAVDEGKMTEYDAQMTAITLGLAFVSGVTIKR